ncbi:MAG: RHS repeat-associated core domain-containing protein [Pseudomonas sp.]|nr:RHS repeat-associated core domain-containing protein [Pseudomonas putida]MDN5673793.1 RHS repeat-associated core domain-containing protein [Pseudomonas sp.]
MINCTLLKRAPKSMSPKKLYFRNGNTLAIISAGDSQSRLLRAVGVPLSQLSSAPEEARLLATDEAHSTLCTQHTHGFHASQYSPYGHSTGESRGTALGYNGELLEPFDFYLLGHGNRAYSTRLMRFLSPDRTGIFLKNNFNCYAYAAGDPVNYTDPSGNTPAFIKNGLRLVGAMRPRRKKNILPDSDFLHMERHQFASKEEFITMGNDLLTSQRQFEKREINHLTKWKDAKRWILEKMHALESFEEIMLPAPPTAEPPAVKPLRVFAFNDARDYLHKSLTNANNLIEMHTHQILIVGGLIRKVESKLNNPHFSR